MKTNSDNWLTKCLKVHGGRYTYDSVIFNNMKDKVLIGCKIHGDFLQSLDVHINAECGCKKCNTNKDKLSTSDNVLCKFKEVHGLLYDYNKVVYSNMSTKVEIICSLHGSFFQTPNNHITKKHICPECSNIVKSKSLRFNIDELLIRFNLVHDNKFTYDLSNYVNRDSGVTIECKKHGIFVQTIQTHLKCGCPKCNSSKSENIIRKYLDSREIKYIEQFKFKDCKYKRSLLFDFYIPSLNLCIEYDGEFHYKDIFGQLEDTVIRDNIKTDYCLLNNIDLLRISYKDNIITKLDFNI